MAHLTEAISPIELVENLLQSKSILEVCRRFLFSELNDFSHTVFVCFFSNQGLVRLEHAQGKDAGLFIPPANIWESVLLKEAPRSDRYVCQSSRFQNVHILPILQNNFAIGALILLGDQAAEVRQLQDRLRLVRLLGGYFLARHLETNVLAIRAVVSNELTQRQLSILEHLCVPLTNAQIALRLHIWLSTVGQELMKIYRFLGVANRSQA